MGMDSVFLNRLIEFSEDVYEPDDSFNSLRKYTGVESHILYLSSFFNDVDIVAFDAVFNTSYIVQTESLTNGADTFIEIFCCDGTPNFTGVSDNRNGQTYTFDCGLNCPPNDSLTLSSLRTFVAAQTGTHYVRITRSVSAPASTGRFGSYVLRIQ